MSEYYTFDTEAEAIDCINAINNSGWFPITGKVNGEDAPPENAKTTCWVEVPTEMLNGRWAIPNIPDSRLDFLGVPQAERDGFNSAFGQNNMELTTEDFPVIEEEIL